MYVAYKQYPGWYSNVWYVQYSENHEDFMIKGIDPQNPGNAACIKRDFALVFNQFQLVSALQVTYRERYYPTTVRRLIIPLRS